MRLAAMAAHHSKETAMETRFRRWARTALAAVLCTQALAAQAVLITFDDLPPPDPEGGFGSTPVSNEYASLGLVIDGFLGGSGVPGTNQVVYGAPSLNLSFIGASLPNYVSMYVSAPNEDKVSVNASGPGGWGQSVDTDGYSWPPGTETPYRDNQYVSLYSPTGISNVNLTAFYYLRTGPVIDNLYFGNVAPVPEPASLAALATGLLVLGAGASLGRRSRKT
jgi:hypothetical protein